jgi:transposase
MLTFCGLDVHKHVVEACLVDQSGRIVQRERFALTAVTLADFARRRLGPNVKVALEATSNAWAVVRMLRPCVAEIVVSNPMQTRAIAQARIKTDKIDALVLAQLLRCDFLPTVWQPDEDTQRLRQLTRRRAGLVAMQTAVKNRLHATLAQRLIPVPVDRLFSKAGLTWMRSLDLDETGLLQRDSDLRLLDGLASEIAGLDQRLAELGQASAPVKLLMTLPGVNVTVAQTVLAALGDWTRFRDGDHAAAYLGLVPRTKQSAERCYHGPITKAGSGQARWMLVQAAQAVGRHPGPLGHFFRRLAQKKTRNVAVVATARKLVVIGWHMLMKNEPYRYAQPLTTETKLQKLRVQATGERRKRGPAKGTFAKPKCQPGVKTRTIKPLAQVLAEENLPPLGALPAGEGKTIAASGAADFVASLNEARVVPRGPKGSRKRKMATTPMPAH